MRRRRPAKVDHTVGFLVVERCQVGDLGQPGEALQLAVREVVEADADHRLDRGAADAGDVEVTQRLGEVDAGAFPRRSARLGSPWTLPMRYSIEFCSSRHQPHTAWWWY
jgi:hypothetical protein